ncbi:MAG TPA: ATP-binding cassette domain-containing protein [Acidimicrobiales bacterium]|nr:ATP-binding cassette domain-containing protein [Acidimicrobiales bacterium]
MGDRPVILAEGLVKRFGTVTALDGVDLEVPAGTVLGLLGPNGAGKTTAVKILTTLLQPDAGRAEVSGFDVVEQPGRVRSAIGLAGQYAAVDEHLTGRENIELVGRLYHLGKAEARRRADDLLERFGLSEAADRTVKTYSGGMRRRLDLGASLVGQRDVLFLDEPSTGLDPRSRTELWALIEELVSEGTTLMLTTQYLDEADRLAHRIAVIDRGKVIAEGTSDELKARVGGEVVELTVGDRSRAPAAAEVVVKVAAGECGEAQVDRRAGRVSVPVRGGAAVLADAVRELDRSGIAIAGLALHRPTLDDVFMALTGRAVEEAEDGTADGDRPAPPSTERRPAAARRPA